MAWEWRGAKRHYYHKVREGKQVRSHHIGSQHAHAFEELSQRRAHELVCKRAWRQSLEETTASLKGLLRWRRLLEAAVLYRQGYHRHAGVWRKKRIALTNNELRPFNQQKPGNLVTKSPATCFTHEASEILRRFDERKTEPSDENWLWSLDLRVLMEDWVENASHLQAQLYKRIPESNPEGDKIQRFMKGRFLVDPAQGPILGDQPFVTIAHLEEVICLLEQLSLRAYRYYFGATFTIKQWEKLERASKARLDRAMIHRKHLMTATKGAMHTLREITMESPEDKSEKGESGDVFACSTRHSGG